MSAWGKVNGRQVPLSHALRKGDICEIIRRRGSQPSRDWLSFVQSSHAREKIRGFFRRLSFEEDVKAGRALLERELSRKGGELGLSDDRLFEVAKSLNYQSLDTMLAHLGSGDLKPQKVMLRLRSMETGADIEEELRRFKRRGTKATGECQITAAGVDGVAFTLARCCHALPGDPIVGYVTRGRGLTVHRPDCQFARYPLQRWKQSHRLRVGRAGGDKYKARIEVILGDRIGILHEVTGLITNMGVNIADIGRCRSRE